MSGRQTQAAGREAAARGIRRYSISNPRCLHRADAAGPSTTVSDFSTPLVKGSGSTAAAELTRAALTNASATGNAQMSLTYDSVGSGQGAHRAPLLLLRGSLRCAGSLQLCRALFAPAWYTLLTAPLDPQARRTYCRTHMTTPLATCRSARLFTTPRQSACPTRPAKMCLMLGPIAQC